MDKLKIGKFFMNFHGWYILGMGILMIFVTEIMFISDFHAYTGVTYQTYYETNQVYAEIFIIQKKLMGLMVSALGILTLFVVKQGFSKGQKWSWYAILIIGVIIWGSFIGYKIIIEYYGGSMITFVVGAVLLVLGLIFPASEFFKKK